MGLAWLVATACLAGQGMGLTGAGAHAATTPATQARGPAVLAAPGGSQGSSATALRGDALSSVSGKVVALEIPVTVAKKLAGTVSAAGGEDGP